MSRYIDAEIIRRIIREQEKEHGLKGMAWIEMAMDKEQPADVQKVRHGRWETDDETGDLQCSECGHFTCEIMGDFAEIDGVIIHRSMNPFYCSRCGSKMDLRGEREEKKT